MAHDSPKILLLQLPYLSSMVAKQVGIALINASRYAQLFGYRDNGME